MDVFQITCHKHLCYIEDGGDGSPFCPRAYEIPEECGRDNWNIYKSDSHHMLLTEHVRTAVHDLNGIVNRLNNQIRPL